MKKECGQVYSGDVQETLFRLIGSMEEHRQGVGLDRDKQPRLSPLNRELLDDSAQLLLTTKALSEALLFLDSGEEGLLYQRPEGLFIPEAITMARMDRLFPDLRGTFTSTETPFPLRVSTLKVPAVGIYDLETEQDLSGDASVFEIRRDNSAPGNFSAVVGVFDGVTDPSSPCADKITAAVIETFFNELEDSEILRLADSGAFSGQFLSSGSEFNLDSDCIMDERALRRIAGLRHILAITYDLNNHLIDYHIDGDQRKATGVLATIKRSGYTDRVILNQWGDCEAALLVRPTYYNPNRPEEMIGVLYHSQTPTIAEFDSLAIALSHKGRDSLEGLREQQQALRSYNWQVQNGRRKYNLADGSGVGVIGVDNDNFYHNVNRFSVGIPTNKFDYCLLIWSDGIRDLSGLLGIQPYEAALIFGERASSPYADFFCSLRPLVATAVAKRMKGHVDPDTEARFHKLDDITVQTIFVGHPGRWIHPSFYRHRANIKRLVEDRTGEVGRQKVREFLASIRG